MLRRRRKHSRIHMIEEIPLQITSLADIMIIVLVFLLKSYSSDLEQDISVPADIHLPVVAKGSASKEDTRVDISESAIKLGGAVVAPLNNYRFNPDELSRKWSSVGTSQALISALSREKQLVAQRNPSAGLGRPLWIFADRKVPYRTIQSVMASAAVEGFTDIKLAVVKEE